MARQLKIWAGLGVAVLASQAQAFPIGVKTHLAPQFVLAAAGEAGETATVAQADNSQGEYIAALGLVDAYVQLADHLKSAEAKARAQKLATDLAPLLKKHKAKISVSALRSLKTAHSAIMIARGTGEDVSAHNMVTAVLQLVQNANTEFVDLGQTPKALSGPQKAWGLVQAAKSIMKDITPQERAEHQAPLAEIDSALATLEPLWPDLKRDQLSKADPKMLPAVAAKIEFALSAIR